jgi:glycosyltransferase involved in cell wall biosynthesis
MAYNHEQYIEECIESILSQRLDRKFEIIIGEDCSTDDTNQLIQIYQDKYKDTIRLISHKKNVGAKRNFKTILDKAKGKYISICEGDDFFFDPEKTMKSINYMEKNLEVTFLFSPAYIVHETILSKKIRNKYKKNFFDNVNLDWVLKNGGGFFPTPTSFFRSSILNDFPDWFQLHCTDDFPLVVLAALKGKIGYIADVTACYRINHGSISNPKILFKEDAIKVYANKLNKNIKFFEKLYRDNIIRLKLFKFLVEKEKYIYNFKVGKLYPSYQRALYVLRCNSSFPKKMKILLRYILK